MAQIGTMEHPKWRRPCWNSTQMFGCAKWLPRFGQCQCHVRIDSVMTRPASIMCKMCLGKDMTVLWATVCVIFLLSQLYEVSLGLKRRLCSIHILYCVWCVLVQVNYNCTNTAVLSTSGGGRRYPRLLPCDPLLPQNHWLLKFLGTTLNTVWQLV